MVVVIYTDGSGSTEGNPGGWAAFLSTKVGGQWKGKVISGRVPSTTNNRMEMTAAIEALRALTRPSDVILYTDSKYVMDGITKWIVRWKIRGWKRGKGELKNVDLWKELDGLNQMHRVEWRWVKGHDGNYWNELVDVVAGLEAKQIGRDADTVVLDSDGNIARDILDRNGDPG